MEITTKQYKRWLKMSQVISSYDDYYSGELMSIVMIEMMKKLDKHPEFELTDSYIFVSLKNRFINMMVKENKINHKKVTDYSDFGGDIQINTGVSLENIEQIDNEYDYELDETNKVKLQVIEDVTNQLPYFDKQLYIIHFIQGKSQRAIARESEITLAIIHERIKKIKNKIKTAYKQLLDEKNN